MTTLTAPRRKRVTRIEEHASIRRERLAEVKQRPARSRKLVPVNREVTKRSNQENTTKPGCWIGLFANTKDF